MELNLIRDINIDDKHVSIKMTLTSPFCPLVNYLVEKVKKNVSLVDEVELVDVDLVWD